MRSLEEEIDLSGDRDGEPIYGEQLIARERTVTRRPRRFKVVLHNDDYTSMDFVVRVLRSYFHKTETEANRVMLEIHHKGAGIAGIYTYDVAETKMAQVTTEAREEGMPLMVSLEGE